jgi:molecular chaperone GrpE
MDETLKEATGKSSDPEAGNGGADALSRCAAERDEYLNGWKRAKADLINYQRDEGKRSEELAKWSVMSLVRDLIPVLDSFDLALASLAKKPKGGGERGAVEAGTVSGIERIRSQLEEVLKRRGLERIVVAPGHAFDPSVHEAIGEVASESPPGTVAEEIERGYELHGKVVRPVRVMLAKS